MSRPRLSGVLPLVLAWLVGCSPAPAPSGPHPGAMRLAVSLPATASPADVARVTVTVSGADMSPLTTSLVLTEGTWGGAMGEIPAGPGRSFLARAFTAANTLRYEGRADDVTITAGATGLVSLSLQDLAAPPPLTNEAPLIDSLVIAPTTVLPGGKVTLTASAHDPNPGDSLSYAWTAPEGEFSTPTTASTTWTAPARQGAVRLTLTVRDSRDVAFSLSPTVLVSTGSGAAQVRVDFNSAPVLTRPTSSQSLLEVGQQTLLSVSASDAEGDSLQYQWSATCAGRFLAPTSASTLFIPSALPTAACNNCQLSVTVKDGQGGQSTGGLALCVSNGVVPRGPERWAPTGALASSRSGHIAVTLLSGQVLVVGGMASPGGALATAELYDPATGTWSPTGAMAQPRFWHQAVTLADGRVLVLGGLNGKDFVLTAELYDPATGTWSLTGAPTAARLTPAATRLAQGKVLVSGGVGASWAALSSAELYDPATGTWSPTGALSTPYAEHTMTPLPSGRVLTVGGGGKSGGASAELYDPATGTWSPAGTPGSVPGAYTATSLPGGKVLVVSIDHVQARMVAQVYDPATGTWSATGAPASRREGHTALLLPNGKVLAVGGLDGTTGKSLTTAELYDPATGTWRRTGEMTLPRDDHTATLLGTGRVLVVGGVSDNGADGLATAELYDPGT